MLHLELFLACSTRRVCQLSILSFASCNLACLAGPDSTPGRYLLYYNLFPEILCVALMRLPYRSISSIQPLPSIYTTFPANYGGSPSTDTSGINSGTCLIKKIEDGIEAVPFERSNILSAPILSPDQEEKEVFVPSCEEFDAFEKPLPSLPRSLWQRMSRRQRILALLVLQFLMLLTIGLSLLAVKRRSANR
jgi:hypothetical protein